MTEQGTSVLPIQGRFLCLLLPLISTLLYLGLGEPTPFSSRLRQMTAYHMGDPFEAISAQAPLHDR